jgi:membrane protein YdbS with pleckstrin-like domain
MSALASKAVPDGFKGVLVVSVSVLLVSLMLLVGDIAAAFVYFSQKATPLWVTVVGAIAVLGVAAGFAGLFVLMAIAGWRSHREARRVQVIPPSHDGSSSY